MDQNTNPNTNQQPTTQPADNGDQGGGKLFTQEEVNNIIKDRLARERAKNTPSEPTEEEMRTLELNARESRIACREYVMDQGLPSELLDVLDTSNHEEFKNKANIVSALLQTSKPSSNADSAALAEMKRRIAYEKGIPQELAARLTGEDESALYKDADIMHGIIKAIKGPAPLADLPYNGNTDIAAGFSNTKHTPKNRY